MVLSAFFCGILRYEGVEVSPISSVSPVEDLEEMEEIFFTLKGKRQLRLGSSTRWLKKQVP